MNRLLGRGSHVKISCVGAANLGKETVEGGIGDDEIDQEPINTWRSVWKPRNRRRMDFWKSLCKHWQLAS